MTEGGTLVMRDEVWTLLLARAAAWHSGNLEAIMAGYAPAVIFVAPGVGLEGLAALRENTQRYLAAYTDIAVTLTRLILDGEQGALEWTWSETRRADGRRHTVEDAIIFVLHKGQILYWREYFDTAALA
ncbi:MAG: nuclear transport factor 2 family protein [Thermomicrobiales bacterium]